MTAAAPLAPGIRGLHSTRAVRSCAVIEISVDTLPVPDVEGSYREWGTFDLHRGVNRMYWGRSGYNCA